MKTFNWRDCYASYVNLDHRTDRRDRMESEFERVGLKEILKPERTRGMYFEEYKGDIAKVQTMIDYMKGMVGCHYSQVKVMETALEKGKSAFVMEDDLDFATDTIKRLDYVQEFLNKNDWDVFWLGGTYHFNDPQWHNIGHRNPRLRDCNCTLGRDVEKTEDPRIVRTYGCWSTYSYIVNYEKLPKILKMLEDNVHRSQAIDHLFIILQPELKTYSFVPAMCKQYDSQSDIGSGVHHFSNFASLGKYWFADKMEDFDPNSLNWDLSRG